MSFRLDYKIHVLALHIDKKKANKLCLTHLKISILNNFYPIKNVYTAYSSCLLHVFINFVIVLLMAGKV